MKTQLFLGAMALAISSLCFAQPPLGENPSLTAARVPAALPDGEEINLSTLEDRLKDTKAIPPLKKLGLKGDIDDLLAKFRLAHAGGYPDVASLRQPYDKLIVKMQAMLRKDPKLAGDIVASKDAIWDRLSDRTKFASLE